MESPEHSRWFKTFTLWRKIQIFDSRNKISFWIIETCVIVIDSQENVLIFSWKKFQLFEPLDIFVSHQTGGFGIWIHLHIYRYLNPDLNPQ